jgi:deoxyribodipyrimidine photo-lyase
MQKLKIFWNRSDFRTIDNPALYYATNIAREEKCLFTALFVFDQHFIENPVYSRRLKFLTTILEDFNNSIPHMIYIDDVENVLLDLTKEYEIEVFANADFDPFGRERDNKVLKLANKLGFAFNLFDDKITINKKQMSGVGTLYSVFTPFKKAVVNDFMKASVLPQANLTGIDFAISKNKFDFNQFRQNIKPLAITVFDKTIDLSHLDKQLTYDWYSNENQVLNQFNNFLKQGYNEYSEDRNTMSKRNSMMSVALKWGMITARQMKDLIVKIDNNAIESAYISELIWREFYKYLLYNYPDLLNSEFLAKYRGKKELWLSNSEQLRHFELWIDGQTGFKAVDASMKQIIQEGYMHNRSRMIVGSILTKNLGVDWRLGQEYFRAMLLDLDEASNNGGWQWCASVGADPKPMRIFNPYLQQEKYDTNFEYINHYGDDEPERQPLLEHTIARDNAALRFKKVSEEYKNTP